MDERFSTECFGAIESTLQNILGAETDPSESDASQMSQIHLLNDNEIIISETSSEDKEEGDSQRNSHIDDGIHGTESSEGENNHRSVSSQRSENARPIDIVTTRTPLQHNQENVPTHGRQDGSHQVSNTFFMNHSPFSDTSSHSSTAWGQNVFSDDEVIQGTESSDSEDSRTSENVFEVNTEISIPETPSDSDEDSGQSGNERETESHNLPHLLPNQNTPTSSPTNRVSLGYSNVIGSRITSSNVINEIHEDDRQNHSFNENEVIVSETSSNSDEENTSNEFVLSGDVIIPETESENNSGSESGNDEVAYELGMSSEITIPETPSESDQEETLSGVENDFPETSNESPSSSPIQNSPTVSPIVDEVPRIANRSQDTFDDVNISNIVEINTERLRGPNFPEAIGQAETISNENPLISPLIESDFPFILPALPQIDDERDVDVVAAVPIEEQYSSEAAEYVEDDDEITILRGEFPQNEIEISAQSRSILQRIEAFILQVIKDLREGNQIQIVVQSRNWANCFLENEKYMLLPISDAKCRHIKSTFSLAVIFYVLGEIHELLLTNKTCTVRELYYKNVNITQKQDNVNEALKTICCILNATPWELGVLSTSKGLIAGPLQIYLPNNVIIDCSIDTNGITLPHLTAGIVDIHTTATHILVVEKDTVFKKLLQNNLIERWKNRCILITGKGYPDTNTRLILSKLRELHALPINVFTDADPYGIEIMLTYRHGSMSMSNLAEALAVPSARWLGVFPSDIRKFGIAAMPLTEDDKRKLDNILNRPFINDHVHRELLIMKQINLKAEIEGISNSNCTYLIDVYLRNKIDNNNGI